MRIDEIVRMQEGFKQKSQGNNKNISKEITEKIEFNVIEALMGKIKGKKGKRKNKAEMPSITTQANPAYNLSLSGPRPPMWDVFWTKREPAMSDEEFEKAIVDLALEYAKKMTEIGNSGKSASMINRELFNFGYEFTNGKKAKLELQYVSVVSPDRKAAFAKTDFTKTNDVLGNEPCVLGRSEIMSWGPSGWSIVPTIAENERVIKFAAIYRETLAAYEKEHGQIPYSTISRIAAPPKNWA